VQVSHGNLVANEQLIRQGFGIDLNPDDVIVSWLPLYHDMGLIGGLLQPIFSGVPCVLMSPAYFLARPLRWLQAISEYGGTISGGPDFAYRLCSERVSEAALAGLDLSRWRVAYSGSEPIRQDSLDTFAEKFPPAASAQQLLRQLWPGRSHPVRQRQPPWPGHRRWSWTPAFAANRAEPGRAASDELRLPAAGPRGAHRRPQQLCAGRQPGRRSLGRRPEHRPGLLAQPRSQRRTFVSMDGQTWLRTGDLGFIRDGEVFVTGRLKDMLIVRGQNLYPQDLEKTLEREVDVVRKGRVAVFAVDDQGEEGIGVAVEISRNVQKRTARGADQDPAPGNRRRLPPGPGVVLLLNPGALPKTSSGKLQRSACRLRMAMAAWIATRFPSVSAAGANARAADLQARIAVSGASCSRSRPWRRTITSCCWAATPSPPPR
jgi:acyl-CoA synthetase (AMP-forming)/AMP-acid ligase II